MASEYAFHLFSTSLREDISTDPSELSVKESHQVYLYCQIIEGYEHLRRDEMPVHPHSSVC